MVWEICVSPADWCPAGLMVRQTQIQQKNLSISTEKVGES